MVRSSDETDWAYRAARLATEPKAGYREVAGEDGPSEEEVVQALRTLGSAWSQMAKVAEIAGRDEAVQRHLVNAGSSLGDAASAFLSELSPSSPERQEQTGEATS